MIDKLRKNYNASSIIIRLLFVLLYCVANFNTCNSIVAAYMGQQEWYVILLVLVLSAVLVMVILPFVITLLLNIARLYNMPRNEYVLIAYVCMCIQFLCIILGNLLMLALPFMGTWITIIMNFIGIAVAMLVFYIITSKLYFNDATKPYYLRVIVIVFAIFVVMGVI